MVMHFGRCEADGAGVRWVELNGEEVSGASVARGMAQLAHCAGFDLTNALAGEVEVFTDLFECARLAAIETEAQLEDFTLAFVERSQQAADLFGQQRCGCYFERRLRRAVFDYVAEFGVAVFSERLRK